MTTTIRFTPTVDLHPLVQGEEVKVIERGVLQNAWVRSVPGATWGVYTLRSSSGETLLRLRHEISA